MTTDEFKDNVLCLKEKLYRVAYVILQDSELSMDIVQDVYVKLWKMRERLSEIKSIEAFSVTMTKNSCIDLIRSRKQIVEFPEIASDEPSRESIIDNRKYLERIKIILEKYPPKQRQVFYLRHFDDCSIEQISEITELSKENVRTILSRIRTTLKTELKDLYEK